MPADTAGELATHTGQAAGYRGDFLSHWLLPLLYPAFLTDRIQIILGALVLALNGTIYDWLLRRRQCTGPA